MPFRNPLQHAWSLLNQHRKFTRSQDKFTIDYMRWLGHHEFGSNHLPFCFSEKTNPHDPMELAYWLFLWDQVYHHLLATAPKEIKFICYETFCSDGETTWHNILKEAALPVSSETQGKLRLLEREIHYGGPQNLLEKCNATYTQLVARSKTVNDF